MNPRTGRALRGGMFAALATLCAAAGHTLGGGGAPSPLFCLVAAAFAIPLATLLAGARPSWWRTALAVGAAQFVFHGLFSITGDLGAGRTSTDAAAPAHVHGALWAGSEAVTAAVPAMTAGHLVAAAVTALALLFGERIVVAILRWIVRSAPLVRGPAPVVPARRPGIPAAARPVAPGPRVIGGVGRRGPPPLLASVIAA